MPHFVIKKLKFIAVVQSVLFGAVIIRMLVGCAAQRNANAEVENLIDGIRFFNNIKAIRFENTLGHIQKLLLPM